MIGIGNPGDSVEIYVRKKKPEFLARVKKRFLWSELNDKNLNKVAFFVKLVSQDTTFSSLREGENLMS